MSHVDKKILLFQRDLYKQQRDELLAALKRKLESELKSRSLGLTRDEVFIEYAEAAIAKVESEK